MTDIVYEAAASTAPANAVNVQRHPLLRRVCHWLNALAILMMIGSGLRIYNWHPALPIAFEFPTWMSLGGDPASSQPLHGEDGLASALAWHFGAMWLLVVSFAVYVIYGFASGHFVGDFLPVGPASFWRDFAAALRGKLSHALGDYNAVQRLFYWGVMLAIVVMILSGFGIWKPVQFHLLTSLFGGYEFARFVHFLGMAAIVGFLFVHVALTILVPKTFVAMVLGEASEQAHPPAGERP